MGSFLQSSTSLHDSKKFQSVQNHSKIFSLPQEVWHIIFSACSSTDVIHFLLTAKNSKHIANGYIQSKLQMLYYLIQQQGYNDSSEIFQKNVLTIIKLLHSSLTKKQHNFFEETFEVFSKKSIVPKTGFYCLENFLQCINKKLYPLLIQKDFTLLKTAFYYLFSGKNLLTVLFLSEIIDTHRKAAKEMLYKYKERQVINQFKLSQSTRDFITELTPNEMERLEKMIDLEGDQLDQSKIDKAWPALLDNKIADAVYVAAFYPPSNKFLEASKLTQDVINNIKDARNSMVSFLTSVFSKISLMNLHNIDNAACFTDLLKAGANPSLDKVQKAVEMIQEIQNTDGGIELDEKELIIQYHMRLQKS